MNRNEMHEAPILRPWYREPWPWVAIGIPAVAVIMGLTTLYLALANPDYLVVEEDQYNVIKSELRAQQPSDTGQPEQGGSRDQEDGDH
jgi:hypothetical protein